MPLLAPAVTHPPPSWGPQNTWLGTPSQVSAESSVLPHMASPTTSLPTPGSRWRWFCTGHLLLAALPSSLPAHMPTLPSCDPRPARFSSQRCPADILLALWPTEPGPHSGGRLFFLWESYCLGRALRGWSAWGQPSPASGGTSVQYLTGHFSFSSKPGPGVALEDGGHLNSRQWNLSRRF